MKFDHIIMNPPYCRNLHLKILSQAINHSDDIVNLSPIRLLQDPLAEYKRNSDFKKFKEIRERIENIEIIKKNDVFASFNISNSENFGVYKITKDGGWCDFDDKVLCRKCFNKIKNNLCKIDYNMKDGWRVRISTISNSNHRIGGFNNLGKLIVFKNGMKDNRKWHTFYQKNKWSKETDEITHSIRFNSETEANNFINTLTNTKFGRWYEGHIITDMNISNNNILWLGDYTHPWTDDDLYQYFELTDDEIKIIEDEIK